MLVFPVSCGAIPVKIDRRIQESLLFERFSFGERLRHGFVLKKATELPIELEAEAHGDETRRRSNRDLERGGSALENACICVTTGVMKNVANAVRIRGFVTTFNYVVPHLEALIVDTLAQFGSY